MSTVTELNKKNKRGVSIPSLIKLDGNKSQINVPQMLQAIEDGCFLYCEDMVVVLLLRERDQRASMRPKQTIS